MCGIVLLHGPNAEARLPECLYRLRHRGPDDQDIWVGDHVALGFTRLEINGEGLSGRQPYRHGGLVGAANCEIYNYAELTRTFGLATGWCDAHVVLPLLELRGPRVIDELDGFYSVVAFHPSTREVICLRDHIGKKPLFVGHSQDELFITSELKALDEVDWFKMLPRGVSQVKLKTGRVTQIAEHRPLRPQEAVSHLLEKAVRKRMPRPDQPIAVFLSGGLDSSLVAAIASQLRDDITYYTLGNPEGADRCAVETVVAALGLKDVRAVPLPPSAIIPEFIRAVVFATESYNPSVVSNGLATFLLAQAAHEDGIKVVLTGEGADELFGGYHSFREQDPWREVRVQLIDDMPYTELRRLDMSCMAHSVEARCPFLDRAVRGFSDQLTYDEMYSSDANKTMLRKSHEGVLPLTILHRPKTSFDVGSGIRQEVVQYLRRNGRSEREELLELWREHFSYDASAPYFHSYPVFDAAIDRRGVKHR